MPQRDQLLVLLEAAIMEPIGLLVQTSDPMKLRQLLYIAKQASGDPRLIGLQFRMSSIQEGNLIIVNAKPKGPKAKGKAQGQENWLLD